VYLVGYGVKWEYRENTKSSDLVENKRRMEVVGEIIV
jgi:hypothetical protein